MPWLLPEIPPELFGPTVIEQRLISPRRIHEHQFSCQGETACCMEWLLMFPYSLIKLLISYLRHSYSHKPFSYNCFESYILDPYLYEMIRPNVVLEAACYLSNTELFKLEKVVLLDDWGAMSRKLVLIMLTLLLIQMTTLLIQL